MPFTFRDGYKRGVWMKSHEKRAIVADAIKRSEGRENVQQLFERAYRAAHDGKLHAKKVSRAVAQYEQGNAPPDYVIDFIAPKDQKSWKMRRPAPGVPIESSQSIAA